MTNLKHWLEEQLLKLNLTDSMNRKNGFTRLGFSQEEKLSHQRFRQIAESLGLKTWQDAIGNQWALWEVDSNAPTIGMGSHLDTVIEGGGYDGVSGIVCALGAIYALKREGLTPKKNIAVICFIAEESARFGVSTIGSKALIGDIDKAKWKQIYDEHGVSIQQAVEAYGLDWDQIEAACCDVDRFESFIELHIEQGSQLYIKRKEIGIVRGISTPVRLKVTANGRANHTGTTLMDERQDALVALSPLVTSINEKAIEMNGYATHPIVATVSTVSLQPNAMNVIPGKVEFGIDIRSVDDEMKKEFAAWIKTECEHLAKSSGVEINVSELVSEKSVVLDKKIQHKLTELCENSDVSYMVMDSGAGHDVMNMAKRWPSGLLFIPSVDGISHHPSEYTPLEYFVTGVEVLQAYIRNASGGDEVEY